MSTTWTDIPHIRVQPTRTAAPLPKPVAFDAPVLIGDCVTPLSGETVLSLLWKRMDGDQTPD